jgi:putative PIN family toxin of toxin-antitoxin system
MDPGVLVSAAISAKAAPRRLLEAAVAGRFTPIVSDLLIVELTDVLHRPKFRRWLSRTDADSFIQAVMLLGEHAPDPDRTSRRVLCRDPDDEYLIALAEDSAATVLVSGDADLLVLEHGWVIVRSPNDALASLDHRP